MGRPRIHPADATATYRADLARQELKARGGARRTYALEPEDLQAIELVMRWVDYESETAMLRALIHAEAKRVRHLAGPQPPEQGPYRYPRRGSGPGGAEEGSSPPRKPAPKP